MRPRKSFLLRIDPGLYEALEAWSQQEMRSVNGQIEFVLKEALARGGRKITEVPLSQIENSDPSSGKPPE